MGEARRLTTAADEDWQPMVVTALRRACGKASCSGCARVQG